VKPMPTAVLAFVVSGRLIAGVGPTSFSNFSVSPTPVASVGGVVAISVQVVDTMGVQGVSVQVRYPDGDETDTPLQFAVGIPVSGMWTAGVTIGKNFSRFDQYLGLIFTSQNAAGAISRSDPFTLILLGAGAAGPQLAFTTVPELGSTSAISATTYGVNPSAAVFVMNIEIPGLGWFTKPFCDSGGTTPVPLAADGSVTTPYATGGIDNLATAIVGYLFPVNSTIPCLSGVDSIPLSFGASAIASTSFARKPPATLTFAGFDWSVEAPGVPVGPNNNYFSANNVFTDNRGLHLTLAQCQQPYGITLCATEVLLTKPTGYGTYTFSLTGPLSTLGEDVVVGLFLYGDVSAYAHHELDFEFW
jgi:hypothetical protein